MHTTDELIDAGYSNDDGIICLKIDKDGLHRSHSPLQLTPKGIFHFGSGEVLVHGSRASKKHLFVPSKVDAKMSFDAVLTRNTSLYCYAPPSLEKEATRWLLSNYRRIHSERTSKLEAILDDIKTSTESVIDQIDLMLEQPA
jgi:hypothetical protein